MEINYQLTKKNQLKTALAELKTAHEAKDVEAIESWNGKIKYCISSSFSRNVCSTTRGAQPGADAGAECTGDDEVTDVDFEEVTEEEEEKK